MACISVENFLQYIAKNYLIAFRILSAAVIMGAMYVAYSDLRDVCLAHKKYTEVKTEFYKEKLDGLRYFNNMLHEQSMPRRKK